MPVFDELIFHETFEEHQSAADRAVVSRLEALEAWDGDRTLVRNKRRQRGQYLLLGYTLAGRGITVVLLETRTVGTWLAYTAWDTKISDR